MSRYTKASYSTSHIHKLSPLTPGSKMSLRYYHVSSSTINLFSDRSLIEANQTPGNRIYFYEGLRITAENQRIHPRISALIGTGPVSLPLTSNPISTFSGLDNLRGRSLQVQTTYHHQMVNDQVVKVGLRSADGSLRCINGTVMAVIASDSLRLELDSSVGVGEIPFTMNTDPFFTDQEMAIAVQKRLNFTSITITHDRHFWVNKNGDHVLSMEILLADGERSSPLRQSPFSACFAPGDYPEGSSTLAPALAAAFLTKTSLRSQSVTINNGTPVVLTDGDYDPAGLARALNDLLTVSLSQVQFSYENPRKSNDRGRGRMTAWSSNGAVFSISFTPQLGEALGFSTFSLDGKVSYRGYPNGGLSYVGYNLATRDYGVPENTYEVSASTRDDSVRIKATNTDGLPAKICIIPSHAATILGLPTSPTSMIKAGPNLASRLGKPSALTLTVGIDFNRHNLTPSLNKSFYILQQHSSGTGYSIAESVLDGSPTYTNGKAETVYLTTLISHPSGYMYDNRGSAETIMLSVGAN